MEKGLARRDAVWIVAAVGAAAVLFLSTLQRTPNSSGDPYATDVGEIQNALSRWGTLHFTGYPLYSATGSALVSVLRAAGIEPAAGASAVSLVWGALAVGATAWLALALGAPGWAAFLGALAFATSTSVWMDASVAEVHTMTMLFTALSLLAAVKVRSVGGKAWLYTLAIAFSQGVVHMRVVVLLAPALLMLVWGRRTEIRAHLTGLILIALCAPLVYVYMPARELMGARWTFGQTSTWRGFWEMVLDTKAERIIQPIAGWDGMLERARVTARLVHQDLNAAVVATGLAGLFVSGPVVGVAMTLAWLPYALLTLVIWEGRVSDALLAVKLPVILLTGVGLATLLGWVERRARWAGALAGGGLALAIAMTAPGHAARVREVTRDRSLEPLVRDVAGTAAAMADENVVVVAPWGHTFWALAYAQGFHGEFVNAQVVDHNADMGAFLSAGRTMVMPSDTLYVLSPEWWRERAAGATIEEPRPGVIAIRSGSSASTEGPGGARERVPITRSRSPYGGLDAPFRVNDDIDLVAADVGWSIDDSSPVRGGSNDESGPVQGGSNDHSSPVLSVLAEWAARSRPSSDYSVAVHLLAGDEVVAQADAVHPADGWSATSLWHEGDTVRDAYAIHDVDPRADTVRITMYRATGGGFENGEWLVLPLPARPN